MRVRMRTLFFRTQRNHSKPNENIVLACKYEHRLNKNNKNGQNFRHGDGQNLRSREDLWPVRANTLAYKRKFAGFSTVPLRAVGKIPLRRDESSPDFQRVLGRSAVTKVRRIFSGSRTSSWTLCRDESSPEFQWFPYE